MAIALYGGSFDPIHIGHLITAQNVIENYDVEKVIFIPSHVTPLKNRKLEASDEDRLKMTYISTKNNNKFIISDYEIMKKDDVSYTYNTLKYFKEIYPDEKIYFIVGTDRAKDLKKWYNIEELSKLVTFIFTARNEFYKTISYEIMISPIIEISSSLIRDNIKNNKSINYMVTDECKAYIEELGLYGISRNSK